LEILHSVSTLGNLEGNTSDLLEGKIY